MLCGIERPNAGEIVFLGRQLVHQHSATHLRQLGLIFQNPRGLLNKTVFENVELPLVIDGVPAPEREKRVLHWLERLGLRLRSRSLYRELSGGEVQKAEFARALIRKPRLILADEPTAHLDSVQADLLTDILWEHYEEGATVFIATHHPPTFDHPRIMRYHVGEYGVRLIQAKERAGFDRLLDVAAAQGDENVEIRT